MVTPRENTSTGKGEDDEDDLRLDLSGARYFSGRMFSCEAKNTSSSELDKLTVRSKQPIFQSPVLLTKTQWAPR
jgi:hypothetical protein